IYPKNIQGVWIKRSRIITGRRPFALDNKNLDYEIDSDEEWEDDDGEELKSDDDEDDVKIDVDEEEDGFVVPEGYFSDDEGDHEAKVEAQQTKSNIRTKFVPKPPSIVDIDFNFKNPKFEGMGMP
ncbi:hypothetical protein HK096_008772, partial [Nowakowskiella sp. JEL0078]